MELTLNNILIPISTESEIQLPSLDKMGYTIDFYSPIAFNLKRNSNVVIPSGFKLNLPDGFVAIIHPSKKLAFQTSMSCPANLIPSSYKDEFSISLTQTGQEDYFVHKNDHLIQMLILPAIKLK